MLKKCFVLLLMVTGLNACYYDIEEELYPKDPNACDTANVTYSATIQPLVKNQCYVCHSQAAAQGNVVLEGHNNIQAYALNGKLYGAVNHTPGFSPMPKSGEKLPDCSITQIRKWIEAGAPNN